MRYLDAPIGRLRGRTPREILILGGALFVVSTEALRPAPNVWHLAYYIIGTLALATRFYAARAIALAFAVSVGVLHSAKLLLGDGWLTHTPWWFGLASMGIAFGLLASESLRLELDLRPSGRGLRYNPWAALPRKDWARSCWIGYAIGVMGNCLLLPWMDTGAGTWPAVLCVGMLASVLLLIAGRSFGFVLAAAAGIGALVVIAPQLESSWTYARDAWTPMPDGLFATRPELALPGAISAVIVVALAAPYAVRHIWRTLTA
jgi:hypothetical protein